MRGEFISRFQRLNHFKRDTVLGRWARLLHFGPLALQTKFFNQLKLTLYLSGWEVRFATSVGRSSKRPS